MAKFTFLLGAGVGYVLGARAGRERYEQIQSVASRLWNSPTVQQQVGTAKDVARTKAAPALADLVSGAAKATGERLRASPTVTSHVVEAHDPRDLPSDLRAEDRMADEGGPVG